jgi:hypothetical protein
MPKIFNVGRCLHYCIVPAPMQALTMCPHKALLSTYPECSLGRLPDCKLHRNSFQKMAFIHGARKKENHQPRKRTAGPRCLERRTAICHSIGPRVQLQPPSPTGDCHLRGLVGRKCQSSATTDNATFHPIPRQSTFAVSWDPCSCAVVQDAGLGMWYLLYPFPPLSKHHQCWCKNGGPGRKVV